MDSQVSSTDDQLGPQGADVILHPVPLAAIALLVINDHLLKHHFPGGISGKLSDIAGMVFFPLFLYALLQTIRSLRGRTARVALVACAASTALVFSAVKTMPVATGAYCVGLGALQWPFQAGVALVQAAPLPAVMPVSAVTDPSDLVAVPFVAVGIYLAWRSRRSDPE